MPAFAAQHALKPQGRPAAPHLRLRRIGRQPIEAVEGQNQPPLVGPPMDIGDLELGILKVGGNDFEVFPVKRNEFQHIHRPLPAVVWCLQG